MKWKNGVEYNGVTNVGQKPTIEGDKPTGIETHIIDFDKDIYGEEVSVELLDFVRPEKKFSSFEELKNSDVVVEDTFYSQAQAHAMLEPHACNARLDEHNRLVIYSSTQTPYHMRRIISKTLGLSVDRVRVVKPRVGGGFGGKQALHGEMFVSLVTLRTKKPSRLIFTREEVFGCSYTRHPMRISLSSLT